MRYVYAHFPININIEKNAETGLFEIDIRYVGEIDIARRAFWGPATNGMTVTSSARRLSDGSLCNQV